MDNNNTIRALHHNPYSGVDAMRNGFFYQSGNQQAGHHALGSSVSSASSPFTGLLITGMPVMRPEYAAPRSALERLTEEVTTWLSGTLD